MSTIENEVKEQRRLSLLLWKAIDSQLELEKAADKLMKDVYEDLAIIGSGGGSGEDWKAMYDLAMQLVDTIKMLKDESPNAVAENNSIDTKVKTTEKVEEVEEDAVDKQKAKEEEEVTEEWDVEKIIGQETDEEAEKLLEGFVEVLMREVHPNLDQIRASAHANIDEVYDMSGLAEQTARPHKFLKEEDDEITGKEDRSMNRQNKNTPSKKQDARDSFEGHKKEAKSGESGESSNAEKKNENSSEHVSKDCQHRKPSPKVLYNDFEEDGSPIF